MGEGSWLAKSGILVDIEGYKGETGARGELERSGLSVSLHAPLHAHAPFPVVECTPSFAGLLVLSQHG